MTNFLLQERLHWSPISAAAPSGELAFSLKNEVPFADPADYKILINDWPYGLAPGIVHICVWLKTRLPVTPETGDLTESSRRLVRDFVRTAFEEKLDSKDADRVLWFKNWTGLQSVRDLEHIHVLVRDIEQEKLDQIIDRASA